MKILRIKDQPEESIICHKGITVRVASLPPGLRKMMLASLCRMEEVKEIIPIFTDAKKIASVVMELPERFTYLNELRGFNKEDKVKFINALELLLWHLTERWVFGDPETFDSLKKCVDCGRSVETIVSKCENSNCPSHAKHRLVEGTAS